METHGVTMDAQLIWMYISCLPMASYLLPLFQVRKRRRRDNDDVDTSQSKNGRGSETVVKKRKGRPPRIAKMAANLGSKHPGQGLMMSSVYAWKFS